MAMQMNVFYLALVVSISLWISSVQGANTVRYASSCTVDMCTPRSAGNNGNNGCSNLPACYQFDTSINTSVCAPQVICSLFDPCNTLRRCTTNTSVCVLNTCCAAPICMPLALTASCSMYTTNNTRIPASGPNICSNATWAENSTIVINSYTMSSSYSNLADFVVDNNNNLYAIDSSGSRVVKFPLSNPSSYNVVAITNLSSSYQPSYVFVDASGTIYTAEYMYQMMMMSYTYRIVQYDQNNLTNGTVVYGPVSCGTGLNELCWCAGFFVDRSGSIYYSDYTNHRVLKITPFVSSATVVAGTTGSFGSALNQLNNPNGIFVDVNGTVFIADQGNYRVMKYSAGSSTGTMVFTMQSFQSPSGVTVDNGGNVYTGTYSGVFRFVPGSNGTTQITPQIYWGINRIRFDTFGNLYTGGYSSSNIYRNNITANSC